MSDEYFQDTSELLMRARCKLLTLKSWYGTMAAMFRWKRNDAVKTIGVRVVDGGYIDCLYNSEFCDDMTVDEMMAVIEHEIEHIVRLHCVRLGTRDCKRWNHATDFVINGKESNPNIKDLPQREPDADGKGGFKGCYYPEEYDNNLTAEELYDRLQKTRIRYKNAGPNGEDIIDGPPDATSEIVVHGEMDDHDVWAGSTVGEDEARQIVKDMVRQASQKAGNCPGHLSGAIADLEEPVVNWKYELRQFMGRSLGGRRLTWSRMNRKRPVFGVKGKSNKASVKLTVGVDTSGSVDQGRLQQFFTELEFMSQKFKITLVQFDHGYQCHAPYHRGDWKTLEVMGRGGTSFIKFFEAIEEKCLVGQCNLVLTDGEATWPEEKRYPVMWVIIPHGNKESVTPPWGSHLFIEK